MANGDALLSFLGTTGTGSWQTFVRAIEDVTGLTLQTYFAARALCARGLVEFDWLGDRSWSVPPLSIIRLEPGRLLGIGLVDDNLSGLLRRNGFIVETRAAIVTNHISYMRSEILDPESHGIEKLECISEHLRFEWASLDAGSILLSALPQIGSTIDSRPLVNLNDAIADGEIRFLDPGSLSFNASLEEIESELNFEVIRVRRQYSAPEYYYVDHRGARRIELELAFAYLAGRAGLRFFHYDSGVLAIDARVPLPILMERVLHFSGARFVGFRKTTSGKGYQCFDSVPASVARVLAMKLLTSVEALPQLDLLQAQGGLR